MHTTPTRTSLQGDCRKYHDREQLNDRLPTEVLSWIFVLCTRICYSDVDEFSVQANVPAVCRQWRAAALARTKLWTYIRLSTRASHTRSALFLSRSGPIAPLSIEIGMLGQTWTYEGDDPSQNVKSPSDLFGFIIKHGGNLSRWQSLRIRADETSTHRDVMEFLLSHPLPTLRHLELLFSLQEGEPNLEAMKQYFLADVDPRPLLHSASRNIDTVKLSAVLHPWLFGHAAHPQFVGLTRLELRFVLYVPTFAHIHKLLAASSNELVVLRLDSPNQARFYRSDGSFRDPNRPPRITFPKLGALSLSVGTLQWDLGVLQMIDAPNLTVLQIKPVTKSDGELEDYIGLLFLLTYSPYERPSPPFRPYFPALTHLSYHGSYIYEELARFFDVYELSSLTVPQNLWTDEMYLKLLGRQSLTRLRISRGDFVQVGAVAYMRHLRGTPFETVEITDGPVDSESVDQLKAWVETVVVHNARAGWEDDDPMNW